MTRRTAKPAVRAESAEVAEARVALGALAALAAMAAQARRVPSVEAEGRALPEALRVVAALPEYRTRARMRVTAVPTLPCWSTSSSAFAMPTTSCSWIPLQR